MKVLSVDDSVTMHKIIAKALSGLEVELLTAKSADAAEEVLGREGEDISLVLLDWNMPGRNGLQLLEGLKREGSRWKDIPVIMLTSEGSEGNTRVALAAGAVGYVNKPFSQEDLVARVMDCLGQSV